MLGRRTKTSAPAAFVAVAALGLIGPASAVAGGEAVVPAAPRPIRVSADRNDGLRLEVTARTELPAGTRLDVAVAFAGRRIDRRWQTVTVEDDGTFSASFRSERSAPAGAYAAIVRFSPRRQALAAASRWGGGRAAHWVVPVYVGEPDDEGEGRKAERALVADAFRVETVLADELEWITRRPGGADRHPRRMRALGWAIHDLRERLAPFAPDRAIAAYHPEAIEDAIALAEMLETAIVGRDAWGVDPADLAAEVARRRSNHERSGLVVSTDADRVEHLIGLAVATVAAEVEVHRGALAASAERVDWRATALELRRCELASSELAKQARSLLARAKAEAELPGAVAWAPSAERLVRLVVLHEDIRVAHATEVRGALDIADPSGAWSRPRLVPGTRSLALAEAERTALVDELQRSLLPMRAARGLRIAVELARLRGLDEQWAPGSEDWSLRVRADRARCEQLETGPLARTGAVRWVARALDALGRRDQVGAGAEIDGSLHEQAFERATTRLEALVFEHADAIVATEADRVRAGRFEPRDLAGALDMLPAPADRLVAVSATPAAATASAAKRAPASEKRSRRSEAYVIVEDETGRSVRMTLNRSRDRAPTLRILPSKR